MSRFKVTTIGEGQLRLSVPAGNRLEMVDQFDVHIAGAEANVTGLLSRLGWSCGWVSSLPDTPLSKRIINEYHFSGLDYSAVKWTKNDRLALYFVEYAAPPRSTQVYYDRSHTAFTKMKAADINWDYLLDTQLLHLTGITPPLSPSLTEIVEEAVKRAKKKGIAVSFDMNYRSRLWSPNEAKKILTPLVQNIDLLFCSRTDAKIIFNIDGTKEEVVARLQELTHAKQIVTTLHREGVIGRDGKKNYYQPACEVEILDRIGAGDALVAGVIHGWLQDNFVKGLKYGVTTAALALSQLGDQVITTRKELESLLESDKIDITR
ncbi:MAG: sugar kinase [Spirochaetes bacterium]|nr:sugar kinase [Spirochaetota bacterium]